MRNILMMVVAGILLLTSNAYASMDTGNSFFISEKGLVMVAIGIWTDDLSDSAEVSQRIKYPLLKALHTRFNQRIKNNHNKLDSELPVLMHSQGMGFMRLVRRSARITFQSFHAKENQLVRTVQIELLKHSGERVEPYYSHKEDLADLLALSDSELVYKINGWADKMMELWLSEPDITNDPAPQIIPNL